MQRMQVGASTGATPCVATRQRNMLKVELMQQLAMLCPSDACGQWRARGCSTDNQ